MRYVLVLALASCGRVGFGDSGVVMGEPGDASPGEPGDASPVGPAPTIDLAMATDENGAVMSGRPIAGATVLVDRGTGSYERLTTDVHGALSMNPDGVIAYHVVYPNGGDWRIYTVATGTTGPIVLGGNAAPRSSKPMTFVLPSGPSPWFTVHVPEQCMVLPEYNAPTVMASYDASCEGRTVRAIAFNAVNDLSSARYVDAGTVKLVEGTRFVASGSYAAEVAHTIKVSNVPDPVTSVEAEILGRDQADLTRMAFDDVIPTSSVTNHAATLTTTTAPGGNALRITAYNDIPSPSTFLSWTQRIAPAQIGSTVLFDAAALLPPFQSLAVKEPNVSWTGATGGTVTIVEVSTGNVKWDAFLAPTATSLTFPAIPADLGVPVPTQFDSVIITTLDVPGASLASVVGTIDQSSRRWPYDPALMPAAGGGRARIEYFVGTAR
jgi:hypothetical protein